MPQIGIADKTTQDNINIKVSTIETTANTINTNVNSINSKVGTNSDVAGTTTLFARLRQIYEYCVNTIYSYLTTNMSSARMAKIDNLDTTVSSRQASWGAVAGTKTNIDNTATTVGTINTNVNTANTNINSINTKVGVSTDISTVASLFGRLKQIWDKVNGLSSGTDFNKPFLSTSVATVDLTNTLVNITGSGYIVGFGASETLSYGIAFISVRIDGATNRQRFWINSGGNSSIIRFNSSINISTNATAANINTQYILD